MKTIYLTLLSLVFINGLAAQSADSKTIESEQNNNRLTLSLSYGIGIEGFLSQDYTNNHDFLPLSDLKQIPFLSEWLHHQLKTNIRYDWNPYFKTGVSLMYQKGGNEGQKGRSWTSTGAPLDERLQSLWFHDVRLSPEIIFDPLKSRNKSLNLKAGINLFHRTHTESYTRIEGEATVSDHTLVSRRGFGYGWLAGMEWERMFDSGWGYGIGMDWLFKYEFQPTEIQVESYLAEGLRVSIPDVEYADVDAFDASQNLLPRESYFLQGFYLSFSLKYSI